jgi:two-component system nitrogen regulation response regulator GlnG
LNADKQSVVWIVDDDSSIRWVLEKALQEDGIQTRSFDRAEGLLDAFAEQQPDVLITDIRMPGMDGIEMMRHLGLEESGLPVIVMTAHADLDSAVAAFKNGAFEYLPKPFDIDLAVSLVRRAFQANEPEATREQTTISTISSMIGQAPAMQDVFRTIGRLSRSSMNVLITGESGTGKELVARALHEHSPRANRPFIALNTTAIAKDLLESELFGHERGAFTGAVSRRKGIFREAHEGTLFLDEIGDMPLDLQPALLRAIEAGRVSPIGSDAEVEIDVRLLAATNRVLELAVADGCFREDLYYRLNVIALEIPPLRERPEDILPLARHFLSRRSAPSKRLSPRASQTLQGYRWPGNVRELANAIERAAILSNTEVILPDHLPPTLTRQGQGQQANADSELKTISELECDAIRAALKHTDGNRTQAAELLGISRRTLVYKLKRMQL